jgi:hypothetical protein
MSMSGDVGHGAVLVSSRYEGRKSKWPRKLEMKTKSMVGVEHLESRARGEDGHLVVNQIYMHIALDRSLPLHDARQIRIHSRLLEVSCVLGIIIFRRKCKKQYSHLSVNQRRLVAQRGAHSFIASLEVSYVSEDYYLSPESEKRGYSPWYSPEVER